MQLTADHLTRMGEAASHTKAEVERYLPQQMAMVGREAREKADA